VPAKKPSNTQVIYNMYRNISNPIKTKTCGKNVYPTEIKGFQLQDNHCLYNGIYGRVALSVYNEWGTVCDDFISS